MQYINSCCKKEQRANISRCEEKQFHPFKLLTKKSTRWHRLNRYHARRRLHGHLEDQISVIRPIC